MPALLFALLSYIVWIKYFIRVREDTCAGITRLGKFHKVLYPGIHFRIPLVDQVQTVDLDSKLPGWRTYSKKELETKVEQILILGNVLDQKRTFSDTHKREEVTWTPQLKTLVAWLIETASREIDIDLKNDELAKTRISEQAQRAIREIASSGISIIDLPFISADVTGPKHFKFTLNRDTLDEIFRGSR